jgi:hypothetical protein
MEPFYDLFIILGVAALIGLLLGKWSSTRPLGDADVRRSKRFRN